MLHIKEASYGRAKTPKSTFEKLSQSSSPSPLISFAHAHILFTFLTDVSHEISNFDLIKKKRKNLITDKRNKKTPLSATFWEFSAMVVRLYFTTVFGTKSGKQ